MNYVKVIAGVITGALFTGTCLAVTFYLFQKNTSASGPLGPASSFAFLGIIFGILYGIVVGGISGAVIIGFQFSLPKAILFGLLFNLILIVVLSVLLGAGLNEKLIYNFLIPCLVGAVNAAIVLLFSPSDKFHI